MRKTWCETLKKDLETNDAVIIPLSGGECSNRATGTRDTEPCDVTRSHKGDAADISQVFEIFL